MQTPTVLKNAYDLASHRGTLESNADAEKRFSELYTPPRAGTNPLKKQTSERNERSGAMNTEVALAINLPGPDMTPSSP